HMRQWKTGNPLDPNSRLGPLVSKEHYDKVSGYLGKTDSILYGGGTSENAFVEATVVEIPGNDHILAQEEIFGPILSVIEVTSLDQAVQIANDTPFGLCASLFTSNAKQALRAARKIKAGTVTVNSFGEGDITTPFGGFKQSGFGGRDNSILAHEQYTQVKTIWLDLTDSQDQSID
ncbi:MAG: aldehyde dehydrogenase family protein, partial [Gammaproteobacteria bacterium]|nr:aldehyde dehydrogenase family protein [Gammaproteobacteria bacterium]